MSPAVACIAAALWVQGSTPLKKTDLIRLLGTSLPPAEIADLVQRRCVSFTPSARDKADLRALGADDLLLHRLDECARKIAPLSAKVSLRDAIVIMGSRIGALVEVRRGGQPAKGIRVTLRGSGRISGGPDAEVVTDSAGRAWFELPAQQHVGTFQLTPLGPDGAPFAGGTPVNVTIRPAPLVAAPARTGFVSGTGQRGRVGSRLPLPLVFEARDTANRPIPAESLTLAGNNARVDRTRAVTDSNGRVAVSVTLGTRAGPAYVVAAFGGLERQAPLVALPGPPAQLVLRCGTSGIGDRLPLRVGANDAVTVRAHDASGNEVALSGLRARAADTRVVDIVVGADAITLRGVRAGSTSLVVEGAGLRRTLAMVVSSDVTAGATHCRSGVTGG